MWPGAPKNKTGSGGQDCKRRQGNPRASDNSITVSIEEIEPSAWPKAVYKPEIVDKADKLYKKPGYGYSKEELEG